jgi:GNAT superfamily N-acetyltransferase
LGFSGHLASKYASSVSLEQASHAFLKGPPPLSGIWVTDCCFDELCTVMGKSWAGTKAVSGEPAKEWMTNHVNYGPDAETKVDIATYYMGSSIAQAMRKGAVVLGRSVDGDITSALIVSEYEDSRSDIERPSSFLGEWWEFGVTLRLLALTIPTLIRCDVYQQEQDRSAIKASALSEMKQGYHNENISQGGYWSVEMVAIDPDCQGKGHGKELMDRLCRLADAADMPCRLEAAGTKNAYFYERAGFQVASQLSVDDPTDAASLPLEVSLMLRLPNAN